MRADSPWRRPDARAGRSLRTRKRIYGAALDEFGRVIVPDVAAGIVVRVEPGAFEPFDEGANQTVLASGPPLLQPRGATAIRSRSTLFV